MAERMKNMIFSCLIGIVSFAVMISFVFFSSDCIPETRNALYNFFDTVFPTMFPFYVLSAIITSCSAFQKITRPLNPLFRIYRLPPESISAIFLGLLCGFPVGAKVICDLHNKNLITKREAALLASFTNNAGPIFTISIIGGTFLQNKTYGLFIWLCTTLSSLITGLILCRLCLNKEKKTLSNYVLNKTKIDVTKAILSGLNTALYVGAVIIFFASITSLLKKIPFISNSTYISIYSFLELTGGLKAMTSFMMNSTHKMPSYVYCAIISAITAWSGICIHLQVCGILKSSGISSKYYLIGKTISSIISFFITIVIFITIT